MRRRNWAWVVCSAALLSAFGRADGADASRSKAELEAAFRAAYGKPSPATVDTPQSTIIYSPAGLVDVDPSAGVLALVAEGRNKDDCEACQGALSVRYLKRTPNGFQRWGKSGGYGFDGNAMGQPPQWKVRRDLEDNPVLTIETGFTGEGYFCAWQRLVELMPGGATTRADNVPLAYDNSGVGDESGRRRITTIEGQIRPLVKGRSFEVDLHGTRSMRLVYERRGETYATRDKKPPTC